MESSLNAPRKSPGRDEKPLGQGKDPKAERFAAVRKVIDQDIRPYIQADGGDIEVLSVEGDRVVVRLLGACVACPSSMMTLRSGVETRLKAKVDQALVVEQFEG